MRSIDRHVAIAVSVVLTFAPAFVRADDNPDDRVAEIRKTLATPDRPEDDRQRDVDRKPAEVLALIDVREGMRVADLMAGGGWYTEVLARVVGPEGRVYAQNNQISNRVAGDRLTQRLAQSKLENIVRLDRELEDPGLPEGELDAVFLVQFYHDTYWMEVDRATMNRRVFEALKPGGVYCVIDHRAEAGSADRDTKSLHRVDPEIVTREVRDAGFVLEPAPDLLANPDDDHTTNVFAPEIRGHTDRFLLMFRKPDAK